MKIGENVTITDDKGQNYPALVTKFIPNPNLKADDPMNEFPNANLVAVNANDGAAEDEHGAPLRRFRNIPHASTFDGDEPKVSCYS